MTCKVVSSLPWCAFNELGEAFTSAPDAVSAEEQPQVRKLCWALARATDGFPPARQAACPGRPASVEARGRCSNEDVQSLLRAVLGHLEALSEDRDAPGEGEARGGGRVPRDAAAAIISSLLHADVPVGLVMCLEPLDFETQKGVARGFDAILRLALTLDAGEQVAEYVRDHPLILELLLEGSGRQGAVLHHAHMLRSLARYPQLVAVLHECGAARTLIGLVRHQNFDIASEAFSSLRAVLLAQKAPSASCLMANFTEFFTRYNELLQSQEYVIQRQALRLLGEMLLDGAFMEVMCAYVKNEQYLQIHMNLLRDSSPAIRFDAFHVFKIFVANPSKPHRVRHILSRNKDKLVRLLTTFVGSGEADPAFNNDLQAVLDMLEMLAAPA